MLTTRRKHSASVALVVLAVALTLATLVAIGFYIHDGRGPAGLPPPPLAKSAPDAQ